MRLSACITTRNRVHELENCLAALWASDVKPHSVIVSDDSSDPEIQQSNRAVVDRYPGTLYVKGPQIGVCGNRNNAVNAVHDSEYVAFVDDDICVPPDFIGTALGHYDRLSPDKQFKTVLSGVSYNQHGEEMLSTKLTFRGYFKLSDVPENVVIHAAVFPRLFFLTEQWDERIFFGYEDAELCLRVKKTGYEIVYCPDLRVFHGSSGEGTLLTPKVGTLTDYDLYIEAARLYIGVKRYKSIFPNPLKLILFVGVYFFHMGVYLLRKNAISALPMILERSNWNYAWNQRGVP
jgi:GT2 family glycosyltransferase